MVNRGDWQNCSIVNTLGDENCYWKQQGAYGWMMFAIAFADGVNGYAVTLIEGIGNDFKTLAVHFYVFGSAEAEVLDPCTFLGDGVRRTARSSGSLRYGLRHGFPWAVRTGVGTQAMLLRPFQRGR
jgi:hypothetical protein